ncbi:ABC-three component system protein [Mycoplana dimorpha]|uniref:ABC-three component systems C-terminal domain-containing protein n=1 Tax=Mycoplana dimorpha TaxID=28320 RepID=A0A2T5BC18_MYCDI|nr:ABC-three component system protein [Mycoplana dimorpha]PTM96519.1 hypothetical protein C7449_103538 [Mycoplana dimorpha]
MNAKVKPAKHSAAGPYLGFALQPVRAFHHLLTSPRGSSVSLEFQDDVAVHYPNGSLRLEQTKSALKQNPIADWAPDLWNTFHNWLKMLQSDAIKADATEYRLYVAPPKAGAFVEALTAATDAAAAKSITAIIRSKLAKLRKDPACLEKLQSFLNATEEQQTAIITNFALEPSAADPLEAIRDILRPSVADIHLDILIKSGIGQAKQAYDRLIQRGEIPILGVDAFRKEFHAFVRQNNMPGLLTSLAAAPDDTLVADFASTRPFFIRQLELVEATNDDLLRAVSDYLRTSADKADWADRGLIFTGSLDTWDDDLVRRHRMIRGDIADLHGDKSATTRGRLVYRQCAQHQAPLEGRAVPGHFVHGSFNDLADRRWIGWHGDFEALLDGDVQ